MWQIIMKSVRQQARWPQKEDKPYDARLAICAYCSHIIDRDEEFITVRRGFAHKYCQPPKPEIAQDSPDRDAQKAAHLSIKDFWTKME